MPPSHPRDSQPTRGLATTTDPRALQTPDGTNRIAATWYSSTSFTIAVNLTDGQAHNIALYALDWDNQGRSEQIQITSAATGAILDTETISSFRRAGFISSGRSRGNVVIQVTRHCGSERRRQRPVLRPAVAPASASQFTVSAPATVSGEQRRSASPSRRRTRLATSPPVHRHASTSPAVTPQAVLPANYTFRRRLTMARTRSRSRSIRLGRSRSRRPTSRTERSQGSTNTTVTTASLASF